MDFGLPYYLYMAETEGYLNTRESKINRVINEIKAYPAETMPEYAVVETLRRNGIDPASVTNKEFNRINYEIKK